MPIDPNDYNPVELPEMEWPEPKTKPVPPADASFFDDMFDMPAFPPTPVEQTRAAAYALAKQQGRLDKLPKNWNPDGTLKDDGD